MRSFKLFAGLLFFALLSSGQSGAGGGFSGVVPTSVNTQSGVTYTLLSSDNNKLVQLTGANPAVTIPTAGGSFPNGWHAWVTFNGTGTATLTPATGTIDAASSASITAGAGAGLFLTTNGTNWFTSRGAAANAAGQVFLNTTNTFGVNGTLDLSAATNSAALRSPNIAGCAPTTNGVLCYDPTNKNIHAGSNGVDNLVPLVPAGALPTTENCTKFLLTSNVLTLADAGSPCGSGGGGSNAGAAVFNSTSSATDTGTSATSIIGGGAQTIPANTLISASPLTLNFGGIYTIPGAYIGTLTIQMLIDGSPIASTGALALPAVAVTNGSWGTPSCQITTRTTGAGGTAILACSFQLNPSSLTSLTPADGSLANTTTFSINTTTSHTIDFQATWSTATGSPSITGQVATGFIGGAPVTSVSIDGGAPQTGAVALTSKVTSVNTLTGAVALFVTNAQTGTYQVLAADFSACKTIPVASGTFTITLVASGSQPPTGQCIDIINYGSGVVTIARSGQNINGGTTSLTVPAGSATNPTGAHVVSDGTNYVAYLIPGTNAANLTGLAPSSTYYGTICSGFVGGAQTTTSTSYVDLATVLSCTFTLAATTNVVFQYTDLQSLSQTGNTFREIFIDGSTVTQDCQFVTRTANDTEAGVCGYAGSLASGSHTATMKYKVNGGTGSFLNRTLSGWTAP